MSTYCNYRNPHGGLSHSHPGGPLLLGQPSAGEQEGGGELPDLLHALPPQVTTCCTKQFNSYGLTDYVNSNNPINPNTKNAFV